MSTDEKATSTAQEPQEITPYEGSSLAPRGSLRASLRPVIASAAESVAKATKKAPELMDEAVGLVRALRLYWERKTKNMEG